jgi:hypothetical protein
LDWHFFRGEYSTLDPFQQELHWLDSALRSRRWFLSLVLDKSNSQDYDLRNSTSLIVNEDYGVQKMTLNS